MFESVYRKLVSLSIVFFALEKSHRERAVLTWDLFSMDEI